MIQILLIMFTEKSNTLQRHAFPWITETFAIDCPKQKNFWDYSNMLTNIEVNGYCYGCYYGYWLLISLKNLRLKKEFLPTTCHYFCYYIHVIYHKW